MTKTSKGFRLSDAALANLRRVQKQTGMSQTAVVEMALALLAQTVTAAPPQLPTGAAAHGKRKETGK